MHNNIAKPAPRSSAICRLRQAKLIGEKITRRIHGGACHLESCQTCGREAAEKWVDQHLLKGHTIEDPWTGVVIVFPAVKLPSGSDKAAKARCISHLMRQRATVELIEQAAARSAFGHLVGYAGVCHISSLSSLEVRFHLHFGFFPGKANASEVLGRLMSFGSKHGFTVEVREREASRLLGWLLYLRHQPLESEEENPKSGFTDEQRRWIEDAIFTPWRARHLADELMYTSLIARFMGGSAIGRRFGKVRARARWAAVMKGGRGMKRQYGDPDSKFADQLGAYLHNVRYCLVCPNCGEEQCVEAVPFEGNNCVRCNHHLPDKAVRAGYKVGAEKRRAPRSDRQAASTGEPSTGEPSNFSGLSARWVPLRPMVV